MTNFKYLQKLLFLFVMAFSFNFICSCGDDEEDEPIQNPSEEITNPTDSIPSEGESTNPNDSIVSEKPINEAVDLGLSVKWATCNVGASSPEQCGFYYAWGETEEKNNYSWDSYKWCNGSKMSMTKYCTSSRYGTVDDKISLDLEDDVAHIKLDKNWRIPTIHEMEELINECTWEWTTFNGVNGRLVTGPNGNSIFFPAAGFRGGVNLFDCYSYGYYWVATLNETHSDVASYLRFERGGVYYDDHQPRCYGMTIRPVEDDM